MAGKNFVTREPYSISAHEAEKMDDDDLLSAYHQSRLDASGVRVAERRIWPQIQNLARHMMCG